MVLSNHLVNNMRVVHENLLYECCCNVKSEGRFLMGIPSQYGCVVKVMASRGVFRRSRSPAHDGDANNRDLLRTTGSFA